MSCWHTAVGIAAQFSQSLAEGARRTPLCGLLVRRRERNWGGSRGEVTPGGVQRKTAGGRRRVVSTRSSPETRRGERRVGGEGSGRRPPSARSYRRGPHAGAGDQSRSTGERRTPPRRGVGLLPVAGMTHTPPLAHTDANGAIERPSAPAFGPHYWIVGGL